MMIDAFSKYGWAIPLKILRSSIGPHNILNRSSICRQILKRDLSSSKGPQTIPAGDRAGDRVDFSIWKAFAPFGGMSYLSAFFGGGLSPPEVVPNGKMKFTHKKLRIWTNIPAWGSYNGK